MSLVALRQRRRAVNAARGRPLGVPATLVAVACLAAALSAAAVGSATVAAQTSNGGVAQSGGFAQSDDAPSTTIASTQTEQRVVGSESTEEVDFVVIALLSISAGMTVLLGVFIWHTSPRRRLRLARAKAEAAQQADAATGRRSGTGE